ncbi:MAG: hypothetical protein KH230_16925 [Enterocloster asparagiformis]|nr:hypothetical protein [Enterocloster asparagiformis]
MKGIITEYDNICACCGKPAEAEHHLIFGKSKDFSEENGLKIPMCNKCHNMGKTLERIHDNPKAEWLSKVVGQLGWEKHAVAGGMTEKEAREAFRQCHGESYL